MKTNIYKSKKHNLDMKKKGGKKHNSKNQKFLAVAVIAVFLIFAIALAFVNVSVNESSVTGAVVTGLGGGNFGNFLQKWMDGSMDPTIIKYMFFIILTVLIYSIFSSASWPTKAGARWLIAIPVAFVAIAFLTPAQLYAALTTYGALALTLIVVLPFAIIVLFSSQILQGKLSVPKILFQLIIWYFYLAFLIYLLISAFFRKGMVFDLGVIIIIGVGVLGSLSIIIFNKGFRHWIRNIGREITQEITEDIGTAAAAGRKLTESHT